MWFGFTPCGSSVLWFIADSTKAGGNVGADSDDDDDDGGHADDVEATR